VTYDEFGLLHDNATEVGLPWSGPPAVRRDTAPLADGRRLSALVWGEGRQEIVFLHGGAQNAHTWDTVALALDRPVVALDLPGHGHSDWRDDHDYSPAASAEDVAVAIRQLAPSPRMVVGMSLGGLTAIALAARYPDLVPRLTVVDVTPGTDHAKAEPIVAFVSGPERFASFDEILERTIKFNPTRSESSLRRGVLHNAREEADGSWTWRYDPMRGWKQGETLSFVPLWEEVDRIAAPILLVRGALSGVVSDEDEAELRRRQPDAQAVTIGGAGHSVQGDQPLELARILTEFLER
jgi:pimeloyl-ACP methyl ester carboxylesterase